MVGANHLEAACARRAYCGEVILGIDQITGGARAIVASRGRALDDIARTDQEPTTLVWCFRACVTDDVIENGLADADGFQALPTSTVMAIPMPPPMHSAARPLPPPRARSA